MAADPNSGNISSAIEASTHTVAILRALHARRAGSGVRNPHLDHMCASLTNPWKCVPFNPDCRPMVARATRRRRSRPNRTSCRGSSCKRMSPSRRPLCSPASRVPRPVAARGRGCSGCLHCACAPSQPETAPCAAAVSSCTQAHNQRIRMQHMHSAHVRSHIRTRTSRRKRKALAWRRVGEVIPHARGRGVHRGGRRGPHLSRWLR